MHNRMHNKSHGLPLSTKIYLSILPQSASWCTWGQINTFLDVIKSSTVNQSIFFHYIDEQMHDTLFFVNMSVVKSSSFLSHCSNISAMPLEFQHVLRKAFWDKAFWDEMRWKLPHISLGCILFPLQLNSQMQMPVFHSQKLQIHSTEPRSLEHSQIYK